MADELIWRRLKGGRNQHAVTASGNSLCNQTGWASAEYWLAAPNKPFCRRCLDKAPQTELMKVLGTGPASSASPEGNPTDG